MANCSFSRHAITFAFHAHILGRSHFKISGHDQRPALYASVSSYASSLKTPPCGHRKCRVLHRHCPIGSKLHMCDEVTTPNATARIPSPPPGGRTVNLPQLHRTLSDLLETSRVRRGDRPRRSRPRPVARGGFEERPGGSGDAEWRGTRARHSRLRL